MSANSEIGIISEKKRKIDFEWTISDFFSYTEEDSRYYSPEFHVLNSRWKIEMQPNGQTAKKSSGYLSLYLWRIESTTPEYVDFTFSIKAVDNVAVNKPELSWKCVNHEGYGWPTFIHRSELQQKKDNLVPSGNLTILCTLRMKVDEKHFDARLKKLAGDLSELCTSDENSDVTLKIDDETISAHRAILAARSPVFAAMFENEMSEKETGIVNIPDCDLEPFKVFLVYIYTGEAEFSKCNVFHLYKIADKYDVSELMMMCIDFMIRNLSIENVCETFVFSHEFQKEKLQSFTQHFFCENFQKVISSDTWKALMKDHRDLANNLLLGIAPKVKIVW